MPSKPLSKPLAHLTSKYLQSASLQCGLPLTGSKPTLMSNLRAAAAAPTTLTPTSRILSIDLGLRNLAFALLTPTHTPKKQHNLTLRAWTRLDLLPPDLNKPTHDFSPPSIAHLAVSLLHTHLLPLSPTHILIERQRFRSGGAAPVLEWTLRVNALETALYAALATLRHLEVWEGRVVTGEEATRGKARATGSKAMKLAKIRLVEASLREGKAVGLGTDEVREAVRRFLAAGESRGRKKGGKKAEGEGVETVETDDGKKRDDLADCLCQGVAWLQWQRNLEDLKKKEPWILESAEEMLE
ncbi:mitochondrial resolvase Ydc2 [Schizothecium vesticola]|uniref:Mitochondrial resolvase Ydc2 n=1 Tax=Schizothecium vesticola TaxID=314040 RepID=A0AA40JZG8_9PEZI|nr:mitochondrial resolvase Ydc2 [Schizothecium vesticola]